MTATRHDQPGARPQTPAGPPLTAGPRWYRTRIRAFGPILGVVPMAVLGAISWLALEIGDGTMSGVIALVAGVSAAPGLLLAGAPFADTSIYPLAIVASIPLWILLGLLAARRATRSPMASWSSYWREMSWLAVGVVIGSAIALGVAAVVLGESLLL